MKKHFALKNYPVKLPILSTVVYAHLMNYYNAPQWAWGVFITLYALLWVVAITIKWNEETVDLFEEKPTAENIEKISRFQQKLAEMVEKNKKATDDGK